MAEQRNANTPNHKTSTKTVTDTIVGEHTHTIVGYSLIKGIGDGEPIASERFTVGGHEWVLLFYPDGKRSSSSEGHMANGAGGEHAAVPPGAIPPPHAHPQAAAAANGPAPAAPAAVAAAPAAHPPAAHAPHAAHGGHAAGAGAVALVGNQQAVVNLVEDAPGNNIAFAQAQAQQQQQQQQQLQLQRMPRRDTTNEYAALFVALIGEGPNPQGVVNTSEGKVVRAFHRFTLVDQMGQGRDLTKGRTREAGAVKISCARQDPNARNCHGYRKFVKRSLLEDPARGYLLNDTLVIHYTIELVVSSGGALSRNMTGPSRSELIKIPPSTIGKELGDMLQTGHGSDCTIIVEDEQMPVHRIILEARSPVFRALLNAPMREGQEGRVVLHDVRAPVVRALLHFVYTDSLPDELQDQGLDTAMAQHLLVAADQYQLSRLRRICEKRLCDTVDVETVATTLALAEQNHAEELKKVCLDYASRNLSGVLGSEGYVHMCKSCPGLQQELLQVLAANMGTERHRGHGGGHVRVRDHEQGEDQRRVRQRRE